MDENRQVTDGQISKIEIKESSTESGVTKRTRNNVNKEAQQAALVADFEKKLPKGIDVANARIGSYCENTNQNDSSPSASPPRKKLISALKEKLEDEERMQRIRIAHEIASNENFRLRDPTNEGDQPPADDKSPEVKLWRLKKSVKDIAEKAFWASVRDDIESNPPRYDHAFILLQEINDILLSLLPQNRVTRCHKRIQEYFDMDLFKQQAQNDTLDVKAIATFIIDTMAMMCAPVRDEQVAALRSIEDVVDIFKKMYEVLKLMSIDFSNFAITTVRPHIQQKQFEYERVEFTKLLKNSSDGLKHTRNWIFNTYQEIREELKNMKEQICQGSPLGAAAADAEDKKKLTEIKKTAFSPFSVLKAAYATLLLPNFKLDNLPETLQMDRKRVEALRLEVNRLVVVSSVMITSCGVFGQPLASHQAFLTKLKETLMTLTEHSSEKDSFDQLSRMSLQCWKEAQGYVRGKGPEVERCVTSSKEDSLKTKVTALHSTHSHPVYSVLYKRTVEYLRVTADIIASHASTTPPSLPSPPAGLSFVAREVVAVALRYAKLVNLNKSIYGPFYVPILREVIGIPNSSGHATPTQEKREAVVSSPGDGGARRKLDMEPHVGGKTANELPDAESTPTEHKVTGSLADLD